LAGNDGKSWVEDDIDGAGLFRAGKELFLQRADARYSGLRKG
jgi:hypothetical protein